MSDETKLYETLCCKNRIITPEQLASGYRILGASGAIWRGEFQVVRKLEDGNYLVHEPRPTAPSPSQETEE